ncbi:hypothetical protein QC764_0092930 [Podospora pseudoanserina]|uniref:Tc1-like transposase DDE domain-containing protein n=1 Tax=Podospora pseudoanserina TaxID=2609844 RepID=A0ABR0HSZ4_9PEZI|nr:hypothetical protein QC764_0092930 [Podospora pseudoanserina]
MDNRTPHRAEEVCKPGAYICLHSIPSGAIVEAEKWNESSRSIKIPYIEKRPSFPNAMTMVAEALESWGSVLGVVTKDNNKKTWGEHSRGSDKRSGARCSEVRRSKALLGSI